MKRIILSLSLISFVVAAACISASCVSDEPFQWEASWIGTGEDPYPDSVWTAPAPCFRKEFSAEKKIKKATALVCGLGFYEMYLNGEKVGDKVLTPPVTNYDKRALGKLIYYYEDKSEQRCLYDVYDVTDMLSEGSNTVGIILGNGWYNQRARTVEGQMWYDLPRVIAQIDIEYSDGKTVRISTDDTWKYSTGALLSDAIFTGEIYDARLEKTGWTLNGYDDSSWAAAKLVRAPSGQLMVNNAPADRVIRSIDVKADTTFADSVYRFSIPELVSGWAQLKVSGKAGSRIKLRFISEEGLDYGQEDTYILSGNGTEVWEPRFTWHTFRTIEAISDVPLTAQNITVKEVRTDLRPAAAFTCSDTLLNKIYEAYVRTQNANMHGSLSSDCPHRERLGYTGDGEVGAPALMFCYDARAFYEKWLNDMEDARNHERGYVPHTAPFAGGGGGPAWGSAIAMIPWLHYLHYGDKSILEDHYDAMKAWVGYLGTRTDERGIVVREEPNGWCLGDWCIPGDLQLPESLVNTCYYYRCAYIAGKTAELLGKEEDAAALKSLCDKISSDFNNEFYDKETGHYWEGRQGSDIIPMYFGMVPDSLKATVAERIMDHLDSLDWHFDTGILATPMVLDVLTDEGNPELALKVLTQKDYPGYGYLLDDANSTLWESWDGQASHCHPMFGSVVAWLFSTVAGIDLEKSDLAGGHIYLHPQSSGLEWCRATYDTPKDTVSVDWAMEGDRMKLKVALPKGVRATVCLDGKEKEIRKTTAFQ